VKIFFIMNIPSTVVDKVYPAPPKPSDLPFSRKSCIFALGLFSVFRIVVHGPEVVAILDGSRGDAS